MLHFVVGNLLSKSECIFGFSLCSSSLLVIGFLNPAWMQLRSSSEGDLVLEDDAPVLISLLLIMGIKSPVGSSSIRLRMSCETICSAESFLRNDGSLEKDNLTGSLL